MQLSQIQAIATHAAQVAYAVLVPVAFGILWLTCLCYHAGQAVAEWWHSAPVQALESTEAIIQRVQNSRLSSTVPIGG